MSATKQFRMREAFGQGRGAGFQVQLSEGTAADATLNALFFIVDLSIVKS